MIAAGIVAEACNFRLFFKNVFVRAGIKLAMLPLTAAVSYEFLMLLARSDFFLFVPFKWLGKRTIRHQPYLRTTRTSRYGLDGGRHL